MLYKKDGGSLKKLQKKNKRRYFRKRVSAKTAVFSAFKSVGQSVKANDTLAARRRRALVESRCRLMLVYRNYPKQNYVH